MNARDELFSLWLKHGVTYESDSSEGRALVDAILAAGYVKHRTITNADEIDALPTGSIVMTTFGTGVNIYRNELIAPDAHYHAVEHGPATVLYEPETAS